MTLLVAAVGLAVSSCAGGGEGAEGHTPTATASPEASPTSQMRTDFDLPPWDEIVAMYEYDTSEPLDYQVLEEMDDKWMRQQDMDPSSGTVYDVSYQSTGYTVPAWLVVPDGEGPFPAVIYAHGSTLDRDFHLPEAVGLAKDGYVGLSITGPENREPFAFIDTGFADIDLAGFVQMVTDLRRGIDLLASLPEVDASRLGFAGLSQGCWLGGALSGLEDRIDGYVLMSCGGYLTEDSGHGLSGETLTRYHDETAVLNAVNYVSHAEGAAFLIQASRSDMPAEDVRALFDAAPEPKELWWYKPPATEIMGGHVLGCDIQSGCDPTLPAIAYHLEWLKENV